MRGAVFAFTERGKATARRVAGQLSGEIAGDARRSLPPAAHFYTVSADKADPQKCGFLCVCVFRIICFTGYQINAPAP